IYFYCHDLFYSLFYSFSVTSSPSLASALSSLSLTLLPLHVSLSLYLMCYQPHITSIAPWDFLILLLISFKGVRSMLHGHHTWHRAGPFHGSTCSTQFLSQMFCVPGPPRNFQISKARHALSS